MRRTKRTKIRINFSRTRQDCCRWRDTSAHTFLITISEIDWTDLNKLCSHDYTERKPHLLFTEEIIELTCLPSFKKRLFHTNRSLMMRSKCWNTQELPSQEIEVIKGSFQLNHHFISWIASEVFCMCNVFHRSLLI